MRVCFLCQSLETLGGVQRAVVLLANELANRGEYIAVLMDGPNLNANPYGLSNRVQILEVEPTGERSIISRCVSKVRQHTGFPRPRIHNGRFPESILTGEEFNLMRSRLADGHFDFVVGCDPLHTIFAVYMCDGFEAKVCGWQHSTYDGYFRQKGRGYYGLAELYKDAIGHCSVNFVLTDESRKVYERESGCSAFVLPNSITDLGLRSKAENCVLYCGRLDSGSKGADYLPAIASGLAESGFEGLFEVVGDGPYRSELERWVSDAELPFQMIFEGFVSNPDDYYRRASVLISPSRWEGFGLSILEGMSHGVPCVAFDNDGPRSIITDGFDGYIVPNGSSAGLVDKTMGLINDAALRCRMGDRAVETARGFLVSTQADTFLSILEGAIDGQEAPYHD